MGAFPPPKEQVIKEAVKEAAKMLEPFDKHRWDWDVTLAGQARISRPGRFEITGMWKDMYQCIAISSRYRFVGQGSTPTFALEAAIELMRKFHDELTEHLNDV